MYRSIMLTLVGVACALAFPAAAADGPTCADCHDEVAAAMAQQVHMRIQPFEVSGRAVGCEACHGDGTRHMEEGDPTLIRSFANPLEDAAVCIDCHSLKNQGEWHASTHAMENIGCLDCHAIHETVNPLNACKDCHQEVYAQFQLPSHHPVPEGKMSCVSCHNPHKDAQFGIKNECESCHADIAESYALDLMAQAGVECADCHSPHAAGATLHTAGGTSGNAIGTNSPLQGVWGVQPSTWPTWASPDSGAYSVVSPATKEYQICFKCHSGYNSAYTAGAVGDNGTWSNGWGSSGANLWTDVALEFNTANASYHPVVGGTGRTGTRITGTTGTMQAGWRTTGQTMTCSDCHQSTTASSTAYGPHGSAVKKILRGYWPTNSADGTGALYTLGGSYTNLLCANCHQARRYLANFAAKDKDGNVIPDTYQANVRFNTHLSDQSDILLGVLDVNDILGVTGKPGAHYSMVENTCVGCHMGEADNHAFTPQVANCVACHADAESIDINGAVTAFEEKFQELHDKLIAEGILDENGAAITKNADGSPVLYDPQTAAAVFVYGALEEDASNGVHNPNYANALLDAALAALGE